MDEMGLKLPPTKIDIPDIRRKFHAAEVEEKDSEERKSKVSQTARVELAGSRTSGAERAKQQWR
jgi:hypothetical protein